MGNKSSTNSPSRASSSSVSSSSTIGDNSQMKKFRSHVPDWSTYEQTHWSMDMKSCGHLNRTPEIIISLIYQHLSSREYLSLSRVNRTLRLIGGRPQSSLFCDINPFRGGNGWLPSRPSLLKYLDIPDPDDPHARANGLIVPDFLHVIHLDAVRMALLKYPQPRIRTLTCNYPYPLSTYHSLLDLCLPSLLKEVNLHVGHGCALASTPDSLAFVNRIMNHYPHVNLHWTLYGHPDPPALLSFNDLALQLRSSSSSSSSSESPSPPLSELFGHFFAQHTEPHHSPLAPIPLPTAPSSSSSILSLHSLQSSPPPCLTGSLSWTSAKYISLIHIPTTITDLTLHASVARYWDRPELSRPDSPAMFALCSCRHLTSVFFSSSSIKDMMFSGTELARMSSSWPALQRLRLDLPLFTAPVNNCQELSVMVVEDVLISQRLIKRMLEKVGVGTIVLANDGVEALEKAKTQKFDMIFMDLGMPRMGGLEATRRIRALGPPNARVPIVALTGQVNEKSEAIESGMEAFYSKPISMQVIRQALVEKTGVSIPVEGVPLSPLAASVETIVQCTTGFASTLTSLTFSWDKAQPEWRHHLIRISSLQSLSIEIGANTGEIRWNDDIDLIPFANANMTSITHLSLLHFDLANDDDEEDGGDKYYGNIRALLSYAPLSLKKLELGSMRHYVDEPLRNDAKEDKKKNAPPSLHRSLSERLRSLAASSASSSTSTISTSTSSTSSILSSSSSSTVTSTSSLDPSLAELIAAHTRLTSLSFDMRPQPHESTTPGYESKRYLRSCSLLDSLLRLPSLVDIEALVPTERHLRTIAENCSGCVSLTLDWSDAPVYSPSDDIMMEIAKRCTRLTSFTAIECPRITSGGMVNFISHVPTLRYLEMNTPLLTGPTSSTHFAVNAVHEAMLKRHGQFYRR